MEGGGGRGGAGGGCLEWTTCVVGWSGLPDGSDSRSRQVGGRGWGGGGGGVAAWSVLPVWWAGLVCLMAVTPGHVRWGDGEGGGDCLECATCVVGWSGLPDGSDSRSRQVGGRGGGGGGAAWSVLPVWWAGLVCTMTVTPRHTSLDDS